MFGDGISLLDLTLLLKEIRAKDLVLEVKVLTGPWGPVSKEKLGEMVKAIVQGKVNGAGDIRLRLFAKNAGPSTTVPPAAG